MMSRFLPARPSQYRLGLLAVFTFALIPDARTEAQANDPYLATLSIERASASVVPLSSSVQFSLHVTKPEIVAAAFAKIDGVDVLSTDNDSIQIVSIEKPTAPQAIDDRFLNHSFVVDFEEISMQGLLENIKLNHGTSPSASDIASYVFNHIDDKTYARSFDLASKVAETGQGDCTEHAVLLAALARANGLYARVVFGTLIMESDTDLSAYGHAWTEIHDGDQWQIVDATLPQDVAAAPHIRYLPISILEDEGPGYAFGMFGIMDSMPSKITDVRNSD